MAQVLNQQNYDSAIGGDKLQVVKFGAEWCGPCRMIAPVLESIGKQHQDVDIYEVDVDQSQELAVKFGVRGVPAVFFLKNGEVVDSFVGAKTEGEIVNLIQKNK